MGGTILGTSRDKVHKMVATKADYQAARNFLDTRGQRAMPIVIGETGWMNKDPPAAWDRALHVPREGATMERMTTVASISLGGRRVDSARLVEICERYGVAELSVFGSLARSEERSDSDVDLLFELTPGTRLGFALFQLERELEELLGKQVDLLPKDSIHHLIRDAVLGEARVLYAA